MKLTNDHVEKGRSQTDAVCQVSQAAASSGPRGQDRETAKSDNAEHRHRPSVPANQQTGPSSSTPHTSQSGCRYARQLSYVVGSDRITIRPIAPVHWAEDR